MAKGNGLLYAALAAGAYFVFGSGGSKADAATPGGNSYSERGYRNNNPGNIAKSSIAWNGKVVPGTDSTYEQFTSMLYGLRALYKNLISYFHDGNNTITKIITKWSGGNNTAAYIASVSADLGVNPNTPLDSVSKKPSGGGLSGINDYLIPLAKAIVKFENGTQRLSDADYQTAYGMI